MTRKEYWEIVQGELNNLVYREKEKVRRELDGHMEDCMEHLLSRGDTAEEAEARAVAVMGDPVETGQAINAQYSMFWLFFCWTVWVLVAIVGVMVVQSLCCYFDVFEMLRDDHFHAYYEARYTDLTEWPADTEFYPVEQTLEIGTDRIVCKEAAVYRVEDVFLEGGPYYVVRLRFLQRDRLPWGSTISGLHSWVRLRSGEYDENDFPGSMGAGTECSVGGVVYFSRVCRVTPGEASVHVSCDYLGQHDAMDVPLNWEGVLE